MKITPWGLAASLLVPAWTFAGPITYTYNYTGNYYVAADSAAPYTSSMYESGSITFAAPIGNNLVDTAVVNPLSYSFNDGYMTIDNATPNLNGPLFYVYTDGSGNITDWLLDFNLLSYTSPVPPDTSSAYQFESVSCGACSTVPLAGNILPSSHDHVGLLPDVPTEDVGYNQGDPGTWTETINGFSGGTGSAPVFLLTGPPIEGITGAISGVGSEDYYGFYWSGGAFSATTSVTGAAGDASYLFTAGAIGSGGCNTLASQTLDSIDSFSSTIAIGSLTPGDYCIGIEADSPDDPNFALTFNTPVEGAATPEPSSFVLLSFGFGMAIVLQQKGCNRRCVICVPTKPGSRAA